ncbi:MAG: hypothetical protein ABL986_05475 [Vicinamibacterales bacterium]
MVITRSGIAALVVLCGAAGAGGAWLANRSSLDPATVTMAAAPVPSSEVAGLTVEASPALLAPPKAAPAPTSRSTVRPVPPALPSAVMPSAPESTPAQAAAVEPAPTEAREPETSRAIEHTDTAAAEPQFEEVEVASDVVLGLQVDTTVSSETARVEDQVVAHVTRDVRVADRVAIPSGTRASGEVTFVEQGGRLRERARLGVRFTSLLLADGSRVPISTDVVFRDGDSPSRESAAKIGGGAIGGAIIGGIFGGGKGAIIGSTAGAGAGTAAVLAGGRNAATLAAGTPVTVRLTRPVVITLDR